jgi:hypothetical protein
MAASERPNALFLEHIWRRQVGSSIMFAIGSLSLRRQRGLILAGASAGIPAAFNTSLAGIEFKKWVVPMRCIRPLC